MMTSIHLSIYPSTHPSILPSLPSSVASFSSTLDAMTHLPQGALGAPAAGGDVSDVSEAEGSDVTVIVKSLLAGICCSS